jgi:lysozyme family protein
MTFDQCFEHLIGIEGSYVNDPRDSGGETNWGVNVAVARKCGYVGEMRDMTIQVAKAIYKAEYWNKAGCDAVSQTMPKLAAEIFDSAVNCGVGATVKWLQTCINVFNNRQSFYKDISVDGAFGSGTYDALRELRSRRPDAETLMLTAMNCLQGAHYINLCVAREKDEAFVYGWFKNRVTV